jgi:hypothetical protein
MPVDIYRPVCFVKRKNAPPDAGRGAAYKYMKNITYLTRFLGVLGRGMMSRLDFFII